MWLGKRETKGKKRKLEIRCVPQMGALIMAHSAGKEQSRQLRRHVPWDFDLCNQTGKPVTVLVRVQAAPVLKTSKMHQSFLL